MEKNIKLIFHQGQNSVIKIVKREPCGRGDVYNLRVPNVFHFSVNGGLIVHNCADELRYGLMSEPQPAITAEQNKQRLFNQRMRENKQKNNKGIGFRMTNY